MKSKSILMVLAFAAFIWASAATAGTVTGTIKFNGTPPEMKKIDMNADPVCTHAHSSAVLSETLVLGPGQTMGNVMVHVKSGLPAGKTYPVPAEPVVLNQKGCQYLPHIIGVRTGQDLKIINSDATLHNIHAMPKINSAFNVAMPQTMKENIKKFRKGEFMFPVKCDVHPWMQSYIGVFDDPYFMATGTDGKYTLKDLPAGTYEIEAWHEKLGTQVMKVTVAATDSKTQDFTFARGQEKTAAK